MDLDRVPGVYTSYTRNADVSGTAPNNRCLILGLMLPGGLATPGVPFLAQSGNQVMTQLGPGTTGMKAHAYRLWKAARAQRPSAEFWIMPLSDPGGTKSTRLLTFTAAAVYSTSNSRWELGTNTAAAEATECYIDVAGQQVHFQVAAADTFATVGAAAIAALSAVTDLVVTPSGNATVTLTDVHGSVLGEDLPVRVWFTNPNCGLGVSTGTITLATNAAGDGTHSITDGIGTGSHAPAAGATPAVEAPLLAAAINAANLTVLAAIPTVATGVITLFHRPDRWVRRFTRATTDSAQTVTAAWGTTGTGTPTLTGAGGPLALNTTDQAYKAWVVPFSDTTTLGAVASQLITQDKTPVEKGQTAFTCISSALPGTSLPGATTPALTTTELFTVGYYQGSPVRAGEIAARMAAEVAGENDHGRNYNGLVLVSTPEMPLAVPSKADQSTRDQWNSAIRQGYAPISANAGNEAYVISCRTTFADGGNAVLLKLTKWSGALLPIYFRADLRRRLAAAFMIPGHGKSIKAKGTPHTARGCTADGVRSEVLAAIREWDALDYFDYAPDIDGAVRPVVQLSPLVIVISAPFRMVADLDQIGIDAYPA